jgi:hypothetical protein
VLRACMNFTDSVVTVKWKAPTDVCGSFSQYSIYGSREGAAFLKLDDIPNIAVTEYPHKLSDLNTTWEYYITVDFRCDGATGVSDTVSIDLTLPNTIQLDSLSYELSTQKIIAGWPKNPSTDTKNYVVYDGTTGNGDSIGMTIDTHYIVTDARQGRYRVRISSTDSCNLFSLLSIPHRAAFLRSSIDTCLQEISLNWDLYSGWSSIDSQSLFVSKDKGITFYKDTTFSGISKTLVFNKFTLGDTLRFYIRSYTRNGKVSSSSNTTQIETRAFVVPDYVYLTLATVYDEVSNVTATPSIAWQTDNIQDVSSFSILSGTELSNLLPIKDQSIVSNQLDYIYDDLPKDAKTRSYFYKVIALDQCGNSLRSSDINNTIHLTIEPQIVHNEYINWDMGVMHYALQKHNGSTWNTLFTQLDPIQGIDFTDSSGCYQIAASEVVNRFNSASTSYSNIVCQTTPLTFSIATAINTRSDNNRFIVLGQGIDHAKSHYTIFNRWGEKITDNRTDVPWYADYKGQLVLPGSYVYVASIVGLLGQKKTTKGIINVIR